MKKYIIIIFCFFIYLPSVCQIDKDFEKHGIKKNEAIDLVQKTLNLNHIDFFFTKEEKKKPLVILKKCYVKPLLNKNSLRKFGLPVQLKTYHQIYKDNDIKFIDFMEVFMVKNKLTITYGFYRNNFVVFAKFIKKDKKWVLLTNNIEQKPKTIVNISLTKARCLAEVLKCKNTDKDSLVGQSLLYTCKRCNEMYTFK